MNLTNKLAWCAAVLIMLARAALAPAAAPETSLLSNGNFESATKQAAQPDDWPMVEGATWEVEDGNHFLRLRPPAPGKMLTVYRVVNVRPGQEAFALRFRVRYTDLKRGKENWHDGRIIIDFKDAAGNKLAPGPKHPNFNGTSKGWEMHSLEFLAPEGAARLEIMPALFAVAGGQLDLDDLTLTPITDPEKLAAMKKLVLPRLTEPVRANVPPPPAEKLPRPLRVVGNQLQTADGKPAWLQGLALPSLEWSVKGENVLKSVEVAIDQWKANIIRLPVREDYWFGWTPGQKDGGEAYRRIIADAVNLAAARGAYLVIDLHRFRAPTSNHAGFWKDVAGQYKDHPAVLFELFNEPHGISWEIWRNGGRVTDKKKETAGVLSENAQASPGFDSVGMQKLLEAIRATGARNVVIAGGLDWGYDLSGILTGYALEDRDGHGIVYSSHVYPWKGDWRGKFLAVAEKHPIFIGECGGEPERMPFVPPERHEDPVVWGTDLLGVVQQHKLHWTAWSFHPAAKPRVIQDWQYAPTPFWGDLVKKALNGERFEAKRMR